MAKEKELSKAEIDRLKAVVGLGGERSKMEQPTAEKNQPLPQIKKEYKETEKDLELFVKLEEHKTIAHEIAAAKNDVRSLEETTGLLEKSEQLKAEAIEKIESKLTELDDRINKIESALAQPALPIETSMAAASETAEQAEPEGIDLSGEL